MHVLNSQRRLIEYVLLGKYDAPIGTSMDTGSQIHIDQTWELYAKMSWIELAKIAYS